LPSTTPTPSPRLHDRAEQTRLAARLGLRLAQLRGGHPDPVAGPGPAGGQDVHEPGEHHADRDAAAQDDRRQAGAGARQVRRVGAGDQRPVPVRHREAGLAAQVDGAAGGVGGDHDPAPVAVGGQQRAVQLTLAGQAQHAAEEVLAVHAEHDPAAELRVVPGRVDRGGEDERQLLPPGGQAAIA
jgi:hypothetical protein